MDMRNSVIGLVAAALCVLAAPAFAFDLSRLLPRVALAAPAWRLVEAPLDASAPASSSAPARESATAPGTRRSAPPAGSVDPEGADAPAATARPAPAKARPRGWRGLLPGSLK
jgi:hypothetical protein